MRLAVSTNKGKASPCCELLSSSRLNSYSRPKQCNMWWHTLCLMVLQGPKLPKHMVGGGKKGKEGNLTWVRGVWARCCCMVSRRGECRYFGIWVHVSSFTSCVAKALGRRCSQLSRSSWRSLFPVCAFSYCLVACNHSFPSHYQ